MKRLILALIVIVTAASCKDATQAQYNALGKEHLIYQYSADGAVINKWTSTGSVSNEANSDGWYFEDSATNKLVEVTGTVTILVK